VSEPSLISQIPGGWGGVATAVVGAILTALGVRQNRRRQNKGDEVDEAADDVSIASSRAEVRGIEFVERQRVALAAENEKLRASIDVISSSNTKLEIKAAKAIDKADFARRVARQAMKDLRKSNPEKAEELQTNFASFFSELDEPPKPGP
jgi:flagellar biosynthesis regulator FlaF